MSASTITLATLNIWNRMGPWEGRLGAIRQGVSELRPDVLALQEVLHVEGDSDVFDQASLVADGFGYHVFRAQNPENPYPMGNAILSRWPFTRTLAKPLPRAGTDEYRILLLAEIASPFGALPVACTHLNWKLDEGNVREEQLLFVTAELEAFASSSSLPAVLMGDLNADPDADEIRFLRGLTTLGGRRVYFADTYGIVGQLPGTTFARCNPYAAVLREPDRRIDYIFVRGPDEQGRGEPLSARVCFDRPVGDVFASDHFGVLATVSA